MIKTAFWRVKNMRKSQKSLIILLLIIISSPMAALSIEKLKANPTKYNGDIVRLRGDVGFKAAIPFTDLLVYILEDRTGSILVFSAYPKDRGERVSIRAEVVAYIGEEQEVQREEIIERVSQYLVDKEILERDKAEKVSEASLRFINTIANAATGAWFVIEQEKWSFLNL